MEKQLKARDLERHDKKIQAPRALHQASYFQTQRRRGFPHLMNLALSNNADKFANQLKIGDQVSLNAEIDEECNGFISTLGYVR